MQALGNQYGRLQSARGGTISESSSRTSLYLTSLTGAVVALSFVAQASRFSETFFVFALAVLPVVFFLQPPSLIALGIGAAAAVLIALSFLRHQWATWMHVAKALPMSPSAN